MTVLLYLALLLCCVFAALFLAVYCLIKIVQVSNGFSLLDPDASNGLRIRKWFLLGISLANTLRFISSLAEFIIFSIKVVKDNADVESISFYSTTNANIPYAVFIARMLPSISFCGNFSLVSLYLAYLHHTLRGADFSPVRIGWILTNAILFVAALQYVIVFPFLLAENCVIFTAEIILVAVIARYSYSVANFLATNSTMGISKRMIDRFNIFVLMTLVALLFGVVLHLCILALPMGRM